MKVLAIQIGLNRLYHCVANLGTIQNQTFYLELWFNLVIVVTCDHPPPVENTTETSTVQAEYDYLTDITYECVLAYNYSGGNLVQTCQEDGTWSGQSPICLGQ